MPLLFYRDTDGLLKPYGALGDALSFSEAWYSVTPGAAGVFAPFGVPESASGDHAVGFVAGGWVCPVAGVWQLVLTGNVADRAVGVLIRTPSGDVITGNAAKSSLPGAFSGAQVMWTEEAAAGDKFEIFARVEDGLAVPVFGHLAATRLRRYSVTSGLREEDSGEYVRRSGDVMEGPLVLWDEETADPREAATREFAASRVIDSYGQGIHDQAPSQAAIEPVINALAAKKVVAGAGLTGGGALSTGPTLNVGAGNMLDVSADAVGVTSYARTITNWNTAVTNGWYMASGATNGPSSTKTGWWKGLVIAHNSLWVTQMAWPFAQGGIDGGALMVRHMVNGVWDSWYRQNNYNYCWDDQDNLTFLKHGGNSGATSSGTTRFAIGTKTAAASPSASDAWRIQCYDTAGNFTWTGMVMPESGAVSFPKGHSLLAEARAASEPVAADRAATVGMVAEMIVTTLGRLGLLTGTVDPNAITGLLIGDPSDPETEEVA